MMMRLRDLDERRRAVQHVVHVLAGLARHDHAELAAQERDATLHVREVVAHRVQSIRAADEDRRVELPRPALLFEGLCPSSSSRFGMGAPRPPCPGGTETRWRECFAM